MLHFPSTLRSSSTNGLPRRTDILNATQQKSGSNPIFLKIEEELHDARRVRAHGQEEDLRLALDMVINRVTELSSLLTEAYKTQADLEVQLNVAKSNLALVISNNEMLEDALRRDNSGSSKEVGWRRRSGKDSDQAQERQSLEEWQHAANFSNESLPGSTLNSPQIHSQPAPPVLTNANPSQENSRFFRFRFGSNPSSSRPTSRPTTPSAAPAGSPLIPQQVTSPTLSAVPPHVTKELEDLGSELQKEKSARKAAEQEKTNLEAELESLSQALFEEANKMVATERIKRAETEEELKELRMEKEALKNALRLIEGENYALRESSVLAKLSPPNLPEHSPLVKVSRSRSSSEVAIKSRPGSPILGSTIPLPPSPAPDRDVTESSSISTSTLVTPLEQASYDSQVTPRNPPLQSLPLTSPLTFPPELEQPSPWADSSSSSASISSSAQAGSSSLYAAASFAMR
ncbi:hypothetical protein P691DRAFT_801649 [Macrolepiota fuliginosa MF-IS2]|uniref:GDP/GTP exchange factor Sec2 N-terminal domain-containing protein n=1 Tax=Macrolepiota fuliginosa MF-IS2 TaxID=1400762 RepID=A0A9P6C0Z3_9AGAR|nr:hypothetical protein P691DRAFT_801649 [Macrolepiota fuliginosa MF-IS2]